MRLQFTIDVATLDEALVLTRSTAEYVDILELGGALIKNEGAAAISSIKASHPDKVLLADMKTAEGGGREARIAFSAGADLVTVLDGADDDTIAETVAVARSHGKAVVADMITASDLVTRARAVVGLGIAFCEIHAGVDRQAPGGYAIRAVIEAGRQAEVPFAVADGVTLDNIRDLRGLGAHVAVVGAAVADAADPRAAARGLGVALDALPAPGAVPQQSRQGRPHGVPSGPGPGPAPSDDLDTVPPSGEVPQQPRQGRPHGVPSGPGPEPAPSDGLAGRAPTS